MVTRRITALFAAGALSVLAASSASAFVGARLNLLTFSRSVALPGVVLPAGAYTFEQIEPGVNLVRVWNRNRTRAIYTGFTRSIERPATMDPERAIVLGESARGEVPPIAVWYPEGQRLGHEFLYAR